MNGLLLSEHGHRKLKEILKTCSNPLKSKDAVRLAIPEKSKSNCAWHKNNSSTLWKMPKDQISNM